MWCYYVIIAILHSKCTQKHSGIYQIRFEKTLNFVSVGYKNARAEKISAHYFNYKELQVNIFILLKLGLDSSCNERNECEMCYNRILWRTEWIYYKFNRTKIFLDIIKYWWGCHISKSL